MLVSPFPSTHSSRVVKAGDDGWSMAICKNRHREGEHQHEHDGHDEADDQDDNDSESDRDGEACGADDGDDDAGSDDIDRGEEVKEDSFYSTLVVSVKKTMTIGVTSVSSAFRF